MQVAHKPLVNMEEIRVAITRSLDVEEFKNDLLRS